MIVSVSEEPASGNAAGIPPNPHDTAALTEPHEVAEEIVAFAKRLVPMARQQGMPLLAYLLGMAELEAAGVINAVVAYREYAKN